MSRGTNIAFITLGCAKNEVDSDKMKARLAAAGYAIVEDAARADLTIVNTCSFLASAVEEGIDVIFGVLGGAGEGVEPNKVLVAGCMPSRYGAELEGELSEVAGFLPANEEEHVVEKVRQLLGEPQAALAAAATRYAAAPSAYVKISDGCDRFCTYCMIPYIRGRYHSFEAEAIAAEVGELVASGVQEVVLIGQDTGIWGRDLPEPSSTVELLRLLAARFPHTWLRLMYLQPEGITDELLTFMEETPNVCAYLDIPLQHANAEVLRRMNRTGSSASIRALVARIRSVAPSVQVRTTLMAGFPGETPEQFDELLDLVDEVGFDYAGVFAYSQEEGSKAAGFADQVPEELRLERAQRLLDACEAVGFARTKRHVGEVVDCIVEGYERTTAGPEALCRWQGQAPEVDGQVHVPMRGEGELALGEHVRVRIVDAFCYELVGERVS